MSKDILDALASQGAAELMVPGAPSTYRFRISVGMGTCGLAAGAQEILENLWDSCKQLGANAGETPVLIDEVGCRGLCWAEPLVEVRCGDGFSYLFGNMTPFKSKRLVKSLVETGKLPPGCMAVVRDEATEAATPTLAAAEKLPDANPFEGQTRYVMRNAGVVNPLSLAQYCARGGFSAPRSILSTPPTSVISTVEEAGLRGRGGAGFPTGKKWRAVAEQSEETRYFIANADEGDPGAYMDRALIESAPYQVLEGLMIGAYATGAHNAYVFIRSEYPLAERTLKAALGNMREAGLLGENILASGYSLEISVVESAGAYLCGEESSLIAALEGRPPYPRKRPPYPTQSGLWGCPTTVNNVETLATVPMLFARATADAATFEGLGAEGNRGTKIFSVTGNLAKQGLVEVELGTSIEDVINGTEGVKGVQIGGPSGLIMPASLTNLLLDYESLSAIDGVMGSGGIVVLDEHQCIVDLARYYTRFSSNESCRRCRACRDGLARATELLDAFCEGKGTAEDLAELEELSQSIPKRSLCGLGKLSTRPLMGALRYFKQEFEEHMTGYCRAGSCVPLVRLEISEEKCRGERCCLQTCPGNAIKGPFGKPGTIDQRLCLKCWTCMDVCPYGAVSVKPLLSAEEASPEANR